MSENDNNADETARYSAQRANERITEHVATCAQQYERIDQAFKRNDVSHDKIQTVLDDKLVSKDRYTAIERIVWGLVSAVGIAIVAALMSVILK